MKKLISLAIIGAVLATTSIGCGGDAKKDTPVNKAGDNKDGGRPAPPK